MQISSWGWFLNISRKFMFLINYGLSSSQKFASHKQTYRNIHMDVQTPARSAYASSWTELGQL